VAKKVVAGVPQAACKVWYAACKIRDGGSPGESFADCNLGCELRRLSATPQLSAPFVAPASAQPAKFLSFRANCRRLWYKLPWGLSARKG
jgi:hypothetical protein